MDHLSTATTKSNSSPLRTIDQFWRVKVYRLEDENWVDQGTGHLDVPNPEVCLQNHKNYCENFSSLLMKHNLVFESKRKCEILLKLWSNILFKNSHKIFVFIETGKVGSCRVF